MNFKDASFNSYGTIDADIEHPNFGWIPCTFSADDEPTAWLFHAASVSATPYVESED